MQEYSSPLQPIILTRFFQIEKDEIICHPYFLSPGRHVREDIPRIVNEAVSSLEIEIPDAPDADWGQELRTYSGLTYMTLKKSIAEGTTRSNASKAKAKAKAK